MWADDEPVDEAPRAQGPPAQRFGNAQDVDVYKSSPAYTQSPRKKDNYRDSDDRRGGGGYGGGRGDRGYGGGYGGRGGDRDSRDRPSPPIPERPPFTAFMSNVPYELEQQDVERFFAGAGSIEDIRITRWRDNPDRARGCFVQFSDKDSLVQALQKSGELLDGRPCKVDVAIERSRDSGHGWSSGGDRYGSSRGGGFTNYSDNRDRHDRDQRRHHREPRQDEPFKMEEESASSLAERPKLNLKPRSVPKGASGGGGSGGASNIFGAARPVDSSKKLLEVETKISAEKEKIKQEVEAAKEAEGGSNNGGVGGAKRGGGGGGGFKNSYNEKKAGDRSYGNFSSAKGRSSSSGGADNGGFTVPKHVQRSQRDSQEDKDDKKGFETSMNAFDLLNVDDE
mmetsp:Transcript_15968/g.40653  ORF Transcript_15968/g.40653 Transcript_15968/m.40653 type:complete len:395 (+) Transcript_15968:84-1268(+)